MDREIKICVIGLGYVGLPLARLFSTKYNTVGFDMIRRWRYRTSYYKQLLQTVLFVHQISMQSAIVIFM